MRRPPDVERATMKVPRLFYCVVLCHYLTLVKAESGNYRPAEKTMKLKSILCFAALTLFINVQAQDLKILVDKKGKVGFADKNGNQVIQCQYESAQPFRDGVAIVTKSGKTGIIDTKGTVLLPLKYTQISTWNKDLYMVKDGKKLGLANHSGKIVLPVIYSHISKSNCYGRALIALGGKATSNEKKTYMANAKYGIIDNNGNVLITPTYKGLYEFSYDGANHKAYYEGKRLSYSYHYTTDTLITDCSYLGFSKNGFSIYNAGIMDGNGKEILKQGLYYFVMQPQSNMVRYYMVKKNETLCGYHNISTGKGLQVAKIDKNIDNIDYWTHGDFIGDIAPVNGTSWTFIDKTFKTIRSDYTLLKHSQHTGLWAAKNKTGKWDVFDESNNDITSLSGYEDIYFPVNEGDTEIFSVMKNDKYGCITRSGEIKVPFKYDKAIGNNFGVIAVKKDDKWGLISPENRCLIPTEYVDVTLPTEFNSIHFWVTKSDSLKYHFNVSTQKISATGYKSASNFKNGIAHVTPVNMVLNNTPINRAQLFVPNTAKKTIDSADISKSAGAFGYLLDTNDNLLMDQPVSALYRDNVIKEIEKCGNRELSESEKKNILLYVTRENRSYDLKSKISEQEWNY